MHELRDVRFLTAVFLIFLYSSLRSSPITRWQVVSSHDAFPRLEVQPLVKLYTQLCMFSSLLLYKLLQQALYGLSLPYLQIKAIF